MDTTLVIMAAGIGSRFGGGIKQLAPVGPNGEIIMDYSIHDALEAGFNKIVFIIRHDLEKDFKEIIGNRIEKLCKVEYAFQENDNLPGGFVTPAERKKPWGTAHAIMCCRGIVNEPFMVINADDYYGKEAYKKIHDFLVSDEVKNNPFSFCMAGFILKNTLSDNGGVTRGVCKVDSDNMLVDVVETGDITKVPEGAAVPDGDTMKPIDADCYVSMNMWGLTPQFIDGLEAGFIEFLSNVKEGDLKAEYLLPTTIDNLIKTGKATVKVLPTNDKWFGVTYKEDAPVVIDSIKKLVESGAYPNKLS
ncbi:MAG: nucleotidyltransferase [Clostridia bacterium]|nr:nucleotidyltransferase [Clostridia bacterium]